jgi:glycosyltransferase involved in cell wall biosynthesis
LHALGPKFGAEKTLYVSLGKVWLMPGLVGLGVLDSFAYETPMVTTQLPYHSPEIDYLQDGVNGVIVRDSDNPQAYADAVHRVLSDLQYRDTLIQGAASPATNIPSRTCPAALPKVF